MIKKTVVAFFSFLAFFCTTAQTTEISGTLRGAEGREIRLIKVTDWLTKEPQTIDVQVINKDGSFSFTFHTAHIEPVVLIVSFHSMELFAVPNFKHQLQGEQFVYDDRINPFITHPKLPLRFSKNDSLNRYIVEFENVLEEFEYKHIHQLRDYHRVGLLDSLYKIPKNMSKNIRDFYEKYIFYTIGSIKVNYLQTKPLATGKKYLDRQKPNPNDYCFMRFFNNYFNDYFPNDRGTMSFREAQSMINQNKPIDSLLDYLGKDPMLIDEDLRELVCLKILAEQFGNLEPAKKLIQSLCNQTRFPSYKPVAQQIIRNLNRFKKGTAAPEFSLIQTDGNIVTSGDLKGKYLYVMFSKSTCIECLSEMEQMRSVYEKNKDFFEFVTIFLDDKQSDFVSFTKAYKYPWKMLYAGNDYDFIQQWQTKSLPFQALITPEYTILEYPTINVQEGIIPKIEKLSFNENRKRRAQNRSIKPNFGN